MAKEKGQSKAIKVSVGQIADALWGIEDWVRSVREVLSLLPQSTSIEVPSDRQWTLHNGTDPRRLLKGCPPPITDDDEDDDDDCKDKKPKKPKKDES